MAVKYTNSSLASVFIQSPNVNNRVDAVYNPTGIIDKIAIHHMAGNLSIETCGKMFAKASAQVSSTYGIGSDGRIGQYALESQRPWTTSSREIDYKAVTIEVANDGGAPNWHVSDKAMASLIELVADICKRNKIKEIVFTGDKTGNLIMHKWFSATDCPGPYLGSKFPYIASEVNKKLATKTDTFKSYIVEVTSKTLYVRANAGTKYKINTIIKKGERYTIVDEKTVDGLKWGKLKSGAGWISLRHTKKVTNTEKKVTFKEGDKVKLSSSAVVYGTKDKFQNWVYKSNLYVREIEGNRVVISTNKTGDITGAVDKKYLTKI